MLPASAVTAAQMMGDISFLVTLTNFPKEQINDETVELLRPYFAAPDFNYNAAKKVRCPVDTGQDAGWHLATAAGMHHACTASRLGQGSFMHPDTAAVYWACRQQGQQP